MMHARDKRRRAGFSLVEVLIAMFLLIIGIVGVMRLFPTSLRQSQKAAESTVVSQLAETRMNELGASSAQHVYETLARLRQVYHDYQDNQVHGDYQILSRALSGGDETYLQRVTLSVDMPDGRTETYVTYVADE